MALPLMNISTHYPQYYSCCSVEDLETITGSFHFFIARSRLAFYFFNDKVLNMTGWNVETLGSLFPVRAACGCLPVLLIF